MDDLHLTKSSHDKSKIFSNASFKYLFKKMVIIQSYADRSFDDENPEGFKG